MADMPAGISASIRLDEDGRLYGWVFDPRDLERRFVVEILGDGLSLAVVRAELHIVRLRDEGHGDGCYGFAIGLERWTARLTGAANVREVTLFPRDLHRLTP